MSVQRELFLPLRRTEIALTVAGSLATLHPSLHVNQSFLFTSTQMEKEVEIQACCLKQFSQEGILIRASLQIYLFDLCPTKIP